MAEFKMLTMWQQLKRSSNNIKRIILNYNSVLLTKQN